MNHIASGIVKIRFQNDPKFSRVILGKKLISLFGADESQNFCIYSVVRSCDG
jgi:hypothetical protein